MIVSQPSSPPIFHGLAPGAAHTTGVQSVWTAWDLAAIIPVGTILVQIRMTSAATNLGGVRKDATEGSRFHNVANSAGPIPDVTLVAPSATRTVETYDGAIGGANVSYYVEGYLV